MTESIVVYGGGGHGRVLLDLLQALGAGSRVLGVLDDGAPVGSKRAGFEVLGGEAWLRSGERARVALGIGDNQQRSRIAGLCEGLGFELFTAVHPGAVVSAHSELGAGTVVFAGAVVNIGARLGKGCIVNSGAIVEHDCRLGDFSHLSPNAALGGAAELGALVHVGLSACVLPGIRVGDATTVGAGAVVTRPVPANSVAYGVPARVQRSQA